MDIEYILGKSVKLRNAFKTNPELFDLSLLTISDYANLIKYDQSTYLDIIAPLVTKPDNKITILFHLGSSTKYKKSRDRFALHPDEVDRLSNAFYFQLLKSDFDKYIKKERFEKLSKHDQSNFCLQKPQWFFDNFAILPKLTANNLFELAASEPQFVDTHVTSYTGVTTYSGFWLNMIKHDAKYEDVFLANTKSLVSKTEVRTVLRRHPKLVKKITEDVIANSKLKVKEWVLLCDELIRSNKQLFNNWKFSDEMKELLRMDLTVEILTGNSKVSVRSQNAMNKVIKIEKVEDDTTGHTGTETEEE